MAAAGQADMMATWNKLFDFPTAQLLLTHGDLRNRIVTSVLKIRFQPTGTWATAYHQRERCRDRRQAQSWR